MFIVSSIFPLGLFGSMAMAESGRVMDLRTGLERVSLFWVHPPSWLMKLDLAGRRETRPPLDLLVLK